MEWIIFCQAGQSNVILPNSVQMNSPTTNQTTARSPVWTWLIIAIFLGGIGKYYTMLTDASSPYHEFVSADKAKSAYPHLEFPISASEILVCDEGIRVYVRFTAPIGDCLEFAAKMTDRDLIKIQSGELPDLTWPDKMPVNRIRNGWKNTGKSVYIDADSQHFFYCH